MSSEPRSSAPSPTPSTAGESSFPLNPILVQRTRGAHVESLHRGSWVLVDNDGKVLEGAGAVTYPVFARSSTKALQALPLIESGAADAFEMSEPQLALAVASHKGEACHTTVVQGLLDRIGLSVDDLRCGSHRPFDSIAWRGMQDADLRPTALHNNCSGKHAAFLALAKHVGDDPATYTDPESRSQLLVRDAVLEMTGTSPQDLVVAVDGCSAPTFRLPLADLARGFARFANPDGLPTERRLAAERIANAVSHHPDLIGGTRNQICSAISRATGGRLYPKVGAEAVYVIGERGGNRALAIKMDDGQDAGLSVLILHLLRRCGLARETEVKALASWAAGPLNNWAGLVVGETAVLD
jgi:L-asparaginase II